MNLPLVPVTVTLNDIMSDYNGSLQQFCSEQDDAQLALITWQVDIDIDKQGRHDFFVVLAVCFAKTDTDELADMASQLCPQGLSFIYAFIPAYAYGTNAFGIFIAPSQHGETLVTGLVNEVIEQAGIEQAVKNLSKAHK